MTTADCGQNLVTRENGHFRGHGGVRDAAFGGLQIFLPNGTIIVFLD